MLQYLKAQFPTTRAGFFSGMACGASAASFLFASFPGTSKICFVVGSAYLFAAWVLSKINEPLKEGLDG